MSEGTWAAVVAGSFDVPVIMVTGDDIATAEVKDFQPEDFIETKLAKHLDLFVQYAIAAAVGSFSSLKTFSTASVAASLVAWRWESSK